jgi:hypothetical protein
VRARMDINETRSYHLSRRSSKRIKQPGLETRKAKGHHRASSSQVSSLQGLENDLSKSSATLIAPQVAYSHFLAIKRMRSQRLKDTSSESTKELEYF